jgi:hypothetical protein
MNVSIFWMRLNKSLNIPGDESLVKRIQRLESLLQNREPVWQTSQGSMSPSSPSIHGVSTLPLAEPDTRPFDSVSSEITTSEGMQSSRPRFRRPSLFAEANHKRWGAESSIGQACNGVSHAGESVLTIDPAYRSEAGRAT